MDTLELSIDLSPREPWSGILIAELSELGFDGFVETKTGIIAYGDANIDPHNVLKETSLEQNKQVKFEVRTSIIPYQNWNAAWESSFEPVFVDDCATIIAPFHNENDVIGMKVIIEPQMSFGTGHHQTTWLMSKALFQLDSIPQRVLDMGAGTGVLAIIAEKLGAEQIVAVDIEEEAVENIRHNVALNGCSKIKAYCGDIDVIEDESAFGLILANINKNVLKSHMKRYYELTLNGGQLWLSGFFETDVDEMEAVGEMMGFKKLEVLNKEGWALIRLEKTNKL